MTIKPKQLVKLAYRLPTRYRYLAEYGVKEGDVGLAVDYDELDTIEVMWLRVGRTLYVGTRDVEVIQ